MVPLAAIFEFGKPIDFNNAIVVGAVFFALSIPLAIYTGVIVSRYFLFMQELQRARENIMSLVDRFHRMSEIDDEDLAANEVAWLLMAPAAALEWQGDHKAARSMTELSVELQRQIMEEWRTIRSAVRSRNPTGVVDESFEAVHKSMTWGIASLGLVRPRPLCILLPWPKRPPLRKYIEQAEARLERSERP